MRDVTVFSAGRSEAVWCLSPPGFGGSFGGVGGCVDGATLGAGRASSAGNGGTAGGVLCCDGVGCLLTGASLDITGGSLAKTSFNIRRKSTSVDR